MIEKDTRVKIPVLKLVTVHVPLLLLKGDVVWVVKLDKVWDEGEECDLCDATGEVRIKDSLWKCPACDDGYIRGLAERYMAFRAVVTSVVVPAFHPLVAQPKAIYYVEYFAGPNGSQSCIVPNEHTCFYEDEKVAWEWADYFNKLAAMTDDDLEEPAEPAVGGLDV